MDTLLIPISYRERQIINGVISVGAIGGAFLFKNIIIHRIYEFVINKFIKTKEIRNCFEIDLIDSDSVETSPAEKSENTHRLIEYFMIGATVAGGWIVAKYISKRFIEYGNSGGIFFAVPILPYGLSNRIIKMVKPNSSADA